MNSLKIILAAAMLMFASNVLTACTPQGTSEVGVQRIKEAAQLKKSVSLHLEQIPGEENIHFQVVLDNPEKLDISSAEAWLTYNPDHLKGIKMTPNETAFEMAAPYNNDFDHQAGLVHLGRSTATPRSEKSIVLADVYFEKTTEGTTMIEAYDYESDVSGHTSANKIVDGEVFNVLIQPNSPLLVIQ